MTGASAMSGENVAAANWELLEAHRRAVTTSLRGKCPRQEDVEDCVQEAMLRVAQIPDIDGRRLRGLLTTVAYNVAMDMHRDRRRQSAALARMGMLQPTAPDAVALDSCEARSLAAHARRLSFRERAALRGRADGFAPQETAALLGDTPRSIHLALSRARTSLRRLAGAAGALALWLRRHGRGSVRLTTPSIVAVTLGLALLAPGLRGPAAAGSLPGVVTPPKAAAAVWHVAPAAKAPQTRTSLTPTPRDIPAWAPAITAGSPERLTIVAAQAGTPQLVSASAGVYAVNPNEPLLTGVENCLAPGAISVSGQHLGCAG